MPRKKTSPSPAYSCPEAKPGPPAGVPEEPPKRKPILTRLAEMEDLISDSTEPISGKELAYLLADARGEIEELEGSVKEARDALEEAKEGVESAEKGVEAQLKERDEMVEESEKTFALFRRNVFSESLSRPGTFELRMIDAGTEIDIRALDLIRSGKVDVEMETGGGMELGQCGPVTIIRLCPRIPTVLDGIKVRRRCC